MGRHQHDRRPAATQDRALRPQRRRPNGQWRRAMAGRPRPRPTRRAGRTKPPWSFAASPRRASLMSCSGSTPATPSASPPSPRPYPPSTETEQVAWTRETGVYEYCPEIARSTPLTSVRTPCSMNVQSRGAKRKRSSPPRRTTAGTPLRGSVSRPVRRGTDQEATAVAGRCRGGAVGRGERRRRQACRDLSF